MNTQITRIFGFVTLLFAVLIGFTSWNSVFDAEALEENPANRRALLEQAQRPRGTIFARDGTELAVPEEVSDEGAPLFTRRYPEGQLFAHSVGYAFLERGSSGIERFHGDELSGQTDEFESIIDSLSGEQETSDDLRTHLDPDGQQAAIDALGGQAGSVVAIEPSTGAVRVMANVPSFDPNAIPDQLGELNQAEGSPILNRATQARYQPGSTFKVITAAAALDSGAFTPDSVLDGSSPQTIGGVPLENFGGQSFGSVTLTEALTFSVNTVFAQIGEQLGPERMLEYMDRFGFGDEPPIDYPTDQLFASGVYEGQRLLTAQQPIDIGRVAIGQERLQVTPLQMAMVVAAVANDGSLMAPRIGDELIGSDGRVTDQIGSAEAAQVMSPEAADALTAMMVNVVATGTGTAAQIPGVEVAGKTGTAEVQLATADQAWFVCFAPADEPEIALAVAIEDAGGGGGDVAAPIARQVLGVMLGGDDAEGSDGGDEAGGG